MVAETKREAKLLLKGLPSPRLYPEAKEILLVTPDHYRVESAINPFMKTKTGELPKVDRAKATEQWQKLKWTYEDLGLTVHEIPGARHLPDMVFAANQSFVFRDRESGKPSALMSRMRHPSRAAEVSFFADWYKDHGYEVHTLENKEVCFEGAGDALLHPKLPLVWGGYGPRTDKAVYEEIARRFGLQAILLKLSDPFYHLDTCFSILSPKTVAIVESAFAKESVAIVHEVFDEVLSIDREEALTAMAANCFCPNKRDVLLQAGAPKFKALLKKARFETREVDTTEFIKAGGSVFCLKMMLC